MSARHGALLVGLLATALAFDPGAAAARSPKLVVGLVAATIALALTRPRRLPAALPLWLATAGWLTASLAWSPRPEPLDLVPWLAPAAFALVLASTTELTTLAGRCAAVFMTVASGTAIVQWATGARGIGLHGLMGNPNWLGLAVAVAMPLAFDRARRCAGRERAFVVGALLLGVAGLALAQSRVAIVALMLAATLALGRRALAGLGVAAVAALAYVARDALAGRAWLSRVGVDAWLERPLIGHGLGGFRPAFLAAQGERLAALDVETAGARFLHATTAHDDWLQLAIEGGLVALLLGLAAFAVAIGTTRSAAGRTALIVAAIAMLGDATLRQPAVFVLLAFPLADCAPLRAQPVDRAVPWVLVAACALTLPNALTRWLAERAARPARDASPKARLVALERAQGIAPTWREGRLALAIARLEQGDATGALALLDAEGGDLAERIAAGNALVALDRAGEAVAAYRAALTLHPGSFRARANLAEALRRQGDLDGAAEQLRLARALQPHHPKVAPLAERIRRDGIDAATR